LDLREFRRFAVASAIGLRDDYGSGGLRAAAKRSKDGPQARRLLALAARGAVVNRTKAARIGGVGLQVVRDWVVKFNAQGPDGLIDRKAPGQPPRLNDAHRTALAAIIESGPIPAIHGVVRWRIVDLRQWIFEEFRVVVSEQTLSRVLRKMGYRKLSARPRHHAQAEGAIEDFKKRMARPVCKRFYRDRRMISLLQRIRPRRLSPGQDGDTRALVLISLPASSAVF
jgi:transposase